MGYIYKITSPTGRIYIGKTINYVKRLGDYKRCERYNYDSLIHNSIKKYGFDSHVFEIVEDVENGKLSEREIFWIAKLRSYWKDRCRGMNMTKGGEVGSGSWIHDTKRRKKQSKRFTKDGNPFYGKHHTEEFKKKKSKQVSEYNKANGVKIPKWGVDKGRLQVIKPVLKYDKEGNFVQEYESYTEAGLSIGAKPSRVWESVSGRRSQCSGWHFREKTDNYSLKIDVSGVKKQNIKRPVLTLNEDYEIVCEHPSAQEASEFWGIPKTTINRAAMYNWLKPIRSGHVFIYTDLYNEILAAEKAA